MTDNNPGPVRIALADDEPDLRISMTRLLTLLGHNVVYAAADGAELLEACAAHDVDLAIVDLDMPVMDGLTAAEELAERGIPAVLVSGHPDVREVVVEHEPVVTRVMKPATIDKLREAIRVALCRP
ncbi:response regulator [Lacipirellula limnantheis]|uniref:Putative transcriptional regulatory protein pdtaR n=1 Tax=Lacipirellula limnantheis TaxID=2528024 RepID=A0A517TT63_9BACT|nr:response regulator [Lacipirellula limnantheis]QDT71542.1 putative transcriptional regulatory protein pdtaR [Lacipirellula limnantheis]